MNKLMLVSAIALTVALAGCNSTKTGSIISPDDDDGLIVTPPPGGDDDDDDVGGPPEGDDDDDDVGGPPEGDDDDDDTPPADRSFDPTSGAHTAGATAGGIDLREAGVEYRRDGDDFTLTFTGGGLDGQEREFELEGVDTETGAMFAETTNGDLTVFEGDASVAGLVIVHIPAGPQGYSFYGENPAYAAAGGVHTLPEVPEGGPPVTYTYTGNFTGVGSDGETAEGAKGEVTIQADFTSRELHGTVDDLTWDDAETTAFETGTVEFEATWADDGTASYSGTVTSVGNWTPEDSEVQGSFYGQDAAETAGSLSAEGEGGFLIGGFQASREP